MNIIIPLCGEGQRFSSLGYKEPKPLIKCLGKPIIYWVLDNLSISSEDLVLIPYNEIMVKYDFESELKRRYKNINFIITPFPKTNGAADTVNKCIKLIPPNKSDESILIIDGDTFYNVDIVNKSKNINGSGMFYFLDYGKNPIYSYIKLDENNSVLDIKEKQKISNNANIGCYKFNSIKTYKKYFDMLDYNDGEVYISNVFEKMINNNEIVIGSMVNNEDFNCLGTPQQLKTFAITHKNNDNIRVCFDLDKTLVTLPKVAGDYTTVDPIESNIKILRELKNNDCEIIIHTARKMLSNNSNIGKIIKDVGQITIDTLDKFDIPYDELFFGKPYADFYVDDKSISAYDDIEKNIGIYKTNNNSLRDFNSIEVKTFSTITKKSLEKDIIDGEIYYYQNIPKQIKQHFPKFIDYGDNFYEMEKINGLTFSSMYTSKIMNESHLNLLLETIKDLHNIKSEKKCNYKGNYTDKIKKRYKEYDYSIFESSHQQYEELVKWFDSYSIEECKMIHGDLVFTNIILDDFNNIKLIDMRGKLGEEYSIYGDPLYDYAKIYQSLLGYDFLLNEYELDEKYINKMIKHFKEYIMSNYGSNVFNNIEYITKSLLFTLIPLHNNNKCYEYFNLIKKI